MASVALLRLISSKEHSRIQTIERRQVPRVAMQRAVTYGVLREGYLMLADQHFPGSLVNMSNTGMCMVTRHRLEMGMVLKVSLPVSADSPAAPTLVQVMWVMNSAKNRGYCTGLRFII